LESIRQLLSLDFMPHGYCYLWDPWIVWLHVLSDALITLSYYCIPVVLIYFIRKNRDIPFNRIFWMFGTFILACGTTHLMEIWNIWHASYLVAGVIKAITAAVSVITAAMLIPLVPKVISLPGRMHLQEVNRKLAQEIAERKRFGGPIEGPMRRRLTVGFIVALSLTLFISVSSWRGTLRAEQDAYWVSHTHEVMEAIQRTSRHVVEAETSARAFALSGQEPLLAHYQTAREAVYRDEDTLRHLTADNLSQQRRLDDLDPKVQTAIAFAESIVAKRRNTRGYGGSDDALETERLMDVVRAITRDMYAEESRLLSQRIPRIQAGQRLARAIGMVGAILLLGLWGLGWIAVNREIDISARARAQVNILNTELEQRVKQRTAALESEIAERTRAQQANERALQELADQKFALDQHAIVAVTDVQGTIIYVNDKFCTISQYSKNELIGQNHRILNSGHHSKEFFQQMYHSIANGQVWHAEIKNRAKNGSTYWVDTTIVPFVGADGKPRQYVAIRADITERKRAEQALNESLITSDAALKELADQKFALDQHAIVAVTDVQGAITYVNDKFCIISQYSKDELIGQNHRILNSGHHPKEFFQQMYHAIANGQVWHGEIKNRAKDGSIYWVDTTIVPFVVPMENRDSTLPSALTSPSASRRKSAIPVLRPSSIPPTTPSSVRPWKARSPPGIVALRRSSAMQRQRSWANLCCCFSRRSECKKSPTFWPGSHAARPWTISKLHGCGRMARRSTFRRPFRRFGTAAASLSELQKSLVTSPSTSAWKRTCAKKPAFSTGLRCWYEAWIAAS